MGSSGRFTRRFGLPLYEYECSNCHHRFEKIESFSAPAEQACPKCGQTAERQLAAPAIQFKGTGWYVTDYARKNSTPAPATSSPEKSSGTAGETAAPAKASADKVAADKKD
jgi:putative FmdB family regulatory protein